MKYKVGDKVIIISKPKPDTHLFFWNQQMNKWCGKRMTIEKIEHDYYIMKEDAGDGCNPDGHWHWYDSFIDHAATEAINSKVAKQYIVIREMYGYKLGQQVTFLPAGEIFETVRPILKEVLN